MFMIGLGLVVVAIAAGQVWIFLDAKARSSIGQAFVWALLYFAGILFFGAGEFVILLLWCSTRPRKIRDLQVAIDKLLPGSPTTLRHCCVGTAIALDPTERRIALISGQGQKTYAISDIRDFRWNIQQSGRHLSNLPFDFATARENNRIDRSNRQNTGLFIQVRDLESPQWQILFRRKSELRRWFELLTQITEGSLVADRPMALAASNSRPQK